MFLILLIHVVGTTGEILDCVISTCCTLVHKILFRFDKKIVVYKTCHTELIIFQALVCFFH